MHHNSSSRGAKAAAFPRSHVTITHRLCSAAPQTSPTSSWIQDLVVSRRYTVFIRWAPAEPAGANPETTRGFQVQVKFQVQPSLTCWNPARSPLKRNTQTQLPSYCLHTLLSIVYNIHCIDTKLKKKKQLRSEPNNGVGVDHLDTVFRAYCLSTFQTHRICANTVNTGQRRSWEVRKLR